VTDTPPPPTGTASPVSDPVPEQESRQGAPLGARFYRLFAASAISNLGDGVSTVALPLIAADLTRDPRAIAAVVLALRLPWLVFALVAGALVDRWDRRVVMVAADVFRTALVGGLALAIATDNHSLPMLYVVGFLLGIAETMFDNASQTILPSIVESKDQLPRANGRLFAAETITNQFVGPPLGGLLVAVAAAAPFWLDAASFLAAALLVASIPGRFRAPPSARHESAPKPTIRAEIAEGVRWLWRHRLLRDLAILLSLMNMWAMAGFAVMVLFAQEILGLGDVGFGLLLISPAFGSVLGGLYTSRFVERYGAGPVLWFGCFGTAVGMLLMAPLSNPWLMGVVLCFWGLAGVGWNVVTVSLRQTIIPDHLLGRVNSVYRFLGWGSMPIGALAGGLLAGEFGLRAPFWVGGTVLLLASLVIAPGLTTANVEAAQAEASDRSTRRGD
jgi:MFS family permease